VDVGKWHAKAPGTTVSSGEESPADYCRAIEAYLCRKNDGHLIRIVGPSFDLVCGWAARGVPITVAQRGIDRYFERYYANGPRRRPVRVDFCDADVLDVFDEWRRAVGIAHVPQIDSDGGGDVEVVSPARKQGSLPAHLERAVSRLTAMRAGNDRGLDEVVEAIVGELDAARAGAKGLRGHARAELLRRLKELDAQLMAAARGRLPDSARDELRRDAEAELAPFRTRMPQAAFEQSVAACVDRLLRDRLRIPVLSLE
jgi:hypothetical protein